VLTSNLRGSDDKRRVGLSLKAAFVKVPPIHFVETTGSSWRHYGIDTTVLAELSLENGVVLLLFPALAPGR